MARPGCLNNSAVATVSFTPSSLLIDSGASSTSNLDRTDKSDLVSGTLRGIQSRLRTLTLSPGSFSQLSSVFRISSVGTMRARLTS